MKNKSFFKSLLHAAEGIADAFRSERNLRFHFVIANLICIFAYFYGIDSTKWAVLVLTITIVISAELINTAVESAVDTATQEFSAAAKLAEDAAAGAVLVTAAGAVLTGICLFGNPQKIAAALTAVFTDAKKLIPCLIIGILDLIFLFGLKKKDKG